MDHLTSLLTPSGSEVVSWRAVEGTTRLLFGDLANAGVGIQWHDFRVDGAFARSPKVQQPHLEICLNFSGSARIQISAETVELAAGQVAIFTAGGGRPEIQRGAESLHRFMVFQFSPAFLKARCGGQLELLERQVQEFIRGEDPGLFEVRPMNTTLLGLRAPLLDPPVSSVAHPTWYLAKVMELLAHTVYRAHEREELFCHRQRRQNAERVERARYLLERDLENPPSLEMLAKDVGCSPFHLSRIFAEEAGMSIPKFLRMRRIERAAELLRSRRMNVTEAAMAVGYSSLSAFNKAFVEQMGCCPGLYPAVKIFGRREERAEE